MYACIYIYIYIYIYIVLCRLVDAGHAAGLVRVQLPHERAVAARRLT